MSARHLFGCCMLACAATWAAAAETPAAAPLSIADAFAKRDVLQAEISPDGRHVAVLVDAGRSTGVMLIRTADASARVAIQGGWERDMGYDFLRNPRRLTWITSERLAVDYNIGGALGHDLDGKTVARLGHSVVAKAVPSQPESPLVLVRDGEADAFAIIDAVSGSHRWLDYPRKGRLVDYALDGRGELRVVTLSDTDGWNARTTFAQWYRRAGGSDWQKVDEFGITDDGWRALAAVTDADELIVATRQGRDTMAVFQYDPLKRQRGELLAGAASQDLGAVDNPLAGDYTSVVTFGMKPQQHWFDSRWSALQKAVDTALPQRVNRLTGNPRGLVLVHSWGDVEPGRWYLLDSDKMTLRLLLVAMPKIDPARQRPVAVIRYTAPDGLSIPAYLARPAGDDGARPLVVLVHGGPVLRDHWAWDPEVQLLASRGYVVLQPQFRGSAGFGKAFEAAGYGEWGRTMQDDITAGVEHLVATGVADPKRVCIVGGSYGGYAAVWGLIKTPELYRCGVTLAGVADIATLLTDKWSDANSVSREIWRMTIGNAERDRAKLDAVSPLLHAADIRAPLLIAHGDRDDRVPVTHARRLMKAMDAAGRPYEWLLLPDEGHGIADKDNRARYYERLFQFLDRHIGH